MAGFFIADDFMKYNIKYFNFTKNEAKVILFMIVVLVAGFSVKYFKYLSSSGSYVSYDYTKNESIFRKLSGNNINTLVRDSIYQKDSTAENQDINLRQKLKTAEDSVKSTGKKKSKKEEKLKPGCININTAPKEVLIMLPGVGESTADKIISYRESHNGFKKIEHIMKVKGIGKKKFEKLKEYITVE